MALPDYGHPLKLALDVKRIRLKWYDAAARYLVTDEIEAAIPTDSEKKDDDEPTYAFSLIRQFMRMDEMGPFHLENEYIEVESPAFVAAAQVVMEGRRDIAWGRKPLQFGKDELIAFMGPFTDYVEDLEKGERTTEEQEQVEHVRFLLSFLRTEYREHIRDLESLKSLEVTTFELIWSIMLPGMTLLTWDAMTMTPRAVRLVSLEMAHGSADKPRSWTLNCEFVTVNGDTPGIAEITFSIPHFIGAKRILELAAYPFEQLSIPDQEAKKKMLVERGKKCWRLKDWCHRYYDDVAYTLEGDETFRKIHTKSRIILDGEMFDRYSRNGSVPSMFCDLDGEVPFPESRKELTDEEYFLMSPRMYGYTLADRDWLMFQVDRIEDIQWSDKVFEGLDMDPEDKKLIKTLVEEHTGMAIDTEAHKKLGITARKFDDFVDSKGLGLIFNLHGPPGVGKTLTAEAISDVSQSPLYIVGASDLGGDASSLESALTTVFDLAHRWRAVVLIDEADVYLERREIRDMERNALVAVFLRKLEYYPGILFLTTNRVSVFDDAMKSRIDVSMVYNHLSKDARERLWIAFLKKTNMTEDERRRLLREEMRSLRSLPLNGRDIKNIVKIASALASHDKGRALRTEDVLRVVNFSLKQGHISGHSGIVKFLHLHEHPELIPYVVSVAAALCAMLVVFCILRLSRFFTGISP